MEVEMSQSEDEIVDTKSISVRKTYTHAKYYANRRFRPAWSEKYPWVQNKEGRAFCIVCKKFLGNHNAHISRHGQNKSHCRRLQETDHVILDTDKFQISNEPKSQKLEDLINSTILSDSDVMREGLQRTVQTNSSDNFLKEYERIVEVWALKLNRMEPTQQMFAERFINEILFEGQMGTLHRNSMQLNILETVYQGNTVPGVINVV